MEVERRDLPCSVARHTNQPASLFICGRLIFRRRYGSFSHLSLQVIGNKTDLQKREVLSRTAQNWCESKKEKSERTIDLDIFLLDYKIPHFETSAKENIHVQTAFETVVRNAIALQKSNSYQ